MREFLNHMDRFGWAVMPRCLAETESLRLSAECGEANAAGGFRRAGVGRGVTLQVREDIRQDHVMWLDPDEGSPERSAYLARLEVLRLAMNERFFLGLFIFEGHFAIYPAGAFYKAHLDRHAGTDDRVVTTILYLNEGWQPGDGGELKLWTTAGDRAGLFVLIEPRLGTMVSFLAGDHWHEVLPTVKSRRSITGWFLRR